MVGRATAQHPYGAMIFETFPKRQFPDALPAYISLQYGLTCRRSYSRNSLHGGQNH